MFCFLFSSKIIHILGNDVSKWQHIDDQNPKPEAPYKINFWALAIFVFSLAYFCSFASFNENKDKHKKAKKIKNK